jgi:hypothetical protein
MAARPHSSVKLAKITPIKPNKPTPNLQQGKVPGQKAAPGRPPRNIGKYLIKADPDSHTGYEMLNTKPVIISQVEDKFLSNWELPPALQPKYLRKPEVMENQRKKEISKGWVKPRSYQG